MELEESRALDRVSSKQSADDVVNRILTPLLYEELMQAETSLQTICHSHHQDNEKNSLQNVIQRLQDCFFELEKSFQNIRPLNNIIIRAIEMCRVSCFNRTCGILEIMSSDDILSISNKVADLQDIVTHIQEYTIAIGNVEEAPMRTASSVVTRLGALADAGSILNRTPSAIENVAYMSSLILAALSRRDVVSIAAIFRSYWGRRQEVGVENNSKKKRTWIEIENTLHSKDSKFRWLRDLTLILKKRWTHKDAWSDAEARRRHSAFVESAATEEAIKMASYSMKALRGPSGDSMVRVCRAQAMLILEWCVVRRVGKEIDRAARNLNVSDAMHLKSLSQSFNSLERFHRDRLPSMIPKMYEFAAFSMHACDHALILSLSETGLLFPRKNLEPHNWLWLNLEGLSAVRDIQAVRASWLLTGGRMRTSLFLSQSSSRFADDSLYIYTHTHTHTHSLRYVGKRERESYRNKTR